VSEEPIERPPRIKVYVDIADLSSKQRGAVLGLIKDMGFTPAEIGELVVTIPEGQAEEGRWQKRK
jgi:hypothetical protein